MLCSRSIVSKEMLSTYYYDMRVTLSVWTVSVCVCALEETLTTLIGLEAYCDEISKEI